MPGARSRIAAVALLSACGRTPVWIGEDAHDPAVCEQPPPSQATEGATPRAHWPEPHDHVSCEGLPFEGSPFGCGTTGACGFTARCNPRSHAVEPYTCCSDDPAAVGGNLPAYAGRGIAGSEPIFSGENNGIGTSGVCVRTDEIEDALRESAAAGCPVPCNPTWSPVDVSTVCGAGRICCQTTALDAKDCVVDPITGRWRPVRASDIGEKYPDGTIVTDWSPGAHFTHQDPGGTGCIWFVGDVSSAEFWDCVHQLGVADQRGLCMLPEECDDCRDDPGHQDACEELEAPR